MGKKNTKNDQLVRSGNDIIFPNNDLLAQLCGQFDKNLAYIENNIDVEFTHRGNVITALGAEKNLVLKF